MYRVALGILMFINSANMGLPIPVVGNEIGPNYAIDINNALTLVDTHDHSPGKGVLITPNGLNINAALTMNGNFLTNVAGVTLLAQGSTPVNGTVYISGTDLYVTDLLGNNVRITQSGGIAGSPGSISNLTSPASAAYVAGSKTFVWQSNTNIAANLDAASLLLRNISPNSTYAITLQPPAALSSNYSLTLPAIPGSNLFMTLDTSGNFGTASNISGTQIAAASLTGAQLSASANIAGSQLSASAGIVGTQLASATVAVSNMASISNYTATGSAYTNTAYNNFSTVVSVAMSGIVANRPLMFSVSGPLFTATATTDDTTFTFQLYDSTDSIVIATWTVFVSSALTYQLPASFSWSGVVAASASSTFILRAKGQATGVGDGCSLTTPSGVTLSVIQV